MNISGLILLKTVRAVIKYLFWWKFAEGSRNPCILGGNEYFSECPVDRVSDNVEDNSE